MWKMTDPVIAISVYFINYLLGYAACIITGHYFSSKRLIVGISIGLIIAISQFYVGV